ncbi:polymerase delta-interacting protein 2 [Trichinella pseudospiralis]|uniref:Polymerase delta-interacting protein 2 n=1 Tax=Trichinella pseudospiralis TaxID=6337 RepID=A0A0V1FIY0_TRIPS|nr:polymerase delta-interacting protein 2 [Trichinella pseudospiralis]KRY86016.1 polymerase delta-interacting protein 2 [Trichinella pseudospiralis]
MQCCANRFITKSLLLNNFSKHLSNGQSNVGFRSCMRLAEIGKFAQPKLNENYNHGQLFLHRIFGYRGVILFSWSAEVYDRDCQRKVTMSQQLSGVYKTPGGIEIKGVRHTYYQALIDERDWAHIRNQAESVTFLGPQNGSRALYAIPGLDYVCQSDVLPYHSNETAPIMHELFERFLAFDSSKLSWIGRETLKAWKAKNYPWLALSSVHRETTDSIRVTVIPFYMGSREAQNAIIYWWRYCVRLENLGNETVTLRERHWKIFSISGTLDTVRGRGVVGVEPELTNNAPAFQYSSHVSLHAPSGHMWQSRPKGQSLGSFKMERANGQTFECRVPPFALESKQEQSSADPINVVDK